MAHLGDRGDRLSPQLLRGEDVSLGHIGLARAVALEQVRGTVRDMVGHTVGVCGVRGGGWVAMSVVGERAGGLPCTFG